jgi:hypothetical protein
LWDFCFSTIMSVMNPTNKKSPIAKGVSQPSAVKRPVAPPVYRPQPLPKVLQTKKSPAQPAAQPSRLLPGQPPKRVDPPATSLAQMKSKPAAAISAAQQRNGVPRNPSQRNIPVVQRKATPATGRVVQRSVAGKRSNTIQAMFVDPMPPMEHQWKPGLGVFFDPNCGWYCQMSAIKHWVSKLKLKCPDDILPKTSLLAYCPWNEGKALAKGYPKPSSAAAWETRLTQSGPLVVAGKIGGADWGVLGGVGHFVLIVGADATKGTISYLDPLQGNTVKTEDFQHVQDRITSNAYGIDVDKLRQLCDEYEQKLRSKWLDDVREKWESRDTDSINVSGEGSSYVTNDML